MVLVSLLLAPMLMAVAALVERRLGPSAAGWVTALPVSFAVAVIAVALDGGDRRASTMALSAATHVPAQLAFAVIFAAVLTRRGLVLGFASGTGAYLACSAAIAGLPNVVVIGAA